MKKRSQSVEKKSVVTDDTVTDRQSRIVASTFANFELASIQNAYEASTKLLKSAEAECERLRGQIEIRDRDSLEVVNFLQRENSDKSLRIGVLEQELKVSESAAQRREMLSRKRFEELLREKDLHLFSKTEEVMRLNEEIGKLAEYQRERFEMARQIEQQRQSELQMVEEYEHKLSRLKFATVEERVRIRALEEDMAAAFQTQVETKATAVAKLKNSHVHTLNERLQHANDILSQEVSSLAGLATKYQSNVDTLKREMKVSDDLHDDALHHTVQLKAKVRAMTAQRSKMEEDRRALLKSTEETAESQMMSARRTISSLQAQLRESQLVTHSQQKEIKRLKELSGIVLDQRGELEQFFYKAIEHTKSQRSESEEFFVTQREKIVAIPPSTPSSSAILNSRRLPRLLGNGRSSVVSPRTSGRQSAQDAGLSIPPPSPSLRPPAPPVHLPSSKIQSRDGVVSAHGLAVRRNIGSADTTEVDLRVRNLAKSRSLRDGAARSNQPIPTADVYPQTPPATTETVSSRTFDQVATEPFSNMSWSEKETVIKALLAFMNRQFHQRRERLAEETVDWNSGAPSRCSSRVTDQEAPDPETV